MSQVEHTKEHNELYSLLVHASCFILCSVYTRFSSVLSINCKWRWGMLAFLNFSYFSVLYRRYQGNNKVINILYVLKY